MYTINAITPLLNPDISDSEARSVVAGLTDEQKDIALLALTKAFRETMARLRDVAPESEVYESLRAVLGHIGVRPCALLRVLHQVGRKRPPRKP